MFYIAPTIIVLSNYSPCWTPKVRNLDMICLSWAIMFPQS